MQIETLGSVFERRCDGNQRRKREGCVNRKVQSAARQEQHGSDSCIAKQDKGHVARLLFEQVKKRRAKERRHNGCNRIECKIQNFL